MLWAILKLAASTEIKLFNYFESYIRNVWKRFSSEMNMTGLDWEKWSINAEQNSEKDRKGTKAGNQD